MSETAIRQQIFTLISGVTNIGKVYDYERWANDWGVFIQMFKTTVGGKDQVRGWEIGRKRAAARYDDNAEETTTHEYLLRGYMGVRDADATEKTFNALIEAVRGRFRFDFTLGGNCESAGPVSVELIETRSFGSVLCHYCELSLPVTELNSN